MPKRLSYNCVAAQDMKHAHFYHSRQQCDEIWLVALPARGKNRTCNPSFTWIRIEFQSGSNSFRFCWDHRGLNYICLHESGWVATHSGSSSFHFSFRIEHSIRNEISIRNHVNLDRNFTLERNSEWNRRSLWPK